MNWIVASIARKVVGEGESVEDEQGIVEGHTFVVVCYSWWMFCNRVPR